MNYIIAAGAIVAIQMAYVVWGTYRKRALVHNTVFDNLNDGWCIHNEIDLTPESVAHDLQCFGNCEDLTYAEMLPYVRKWMRARGLTT